ncbi:MAG: serine/threonine protein kinase [Planctomycetes bacterium]|nr:serine/threonine protein kinase [Planctomycetota bacterium]
MPNDNNNGAGIKEDLSFGSLAVKLGFITRERIRECLLIQEKIHSFGVRSPKIGEIMIDKGYLTEEQVSKIFRTQGLKGGHNQIAGYKILSLIGQGAMGNVYKATQISMDRTVAIKILAPHLAQDDKFVERFFKEARFVAKLNHPNIIQGIDVGESNGVHYFTMEYIDGPTIESLVKLRGAMQERKAIKIIMQVATGHT